MWFVLRGIEGEEEGREEKVREVKEEGSEGRDTEEEECRRWEKKVVLRGGTWRRKISVGSWHGFQTWGEEWVVLRSSLSGLWCVLVALRECTWMFPHLRSLRNCNQLPPDCAE